MRLSSSLSIGAALIGSALLSFTGVAQANEWDHDRWERDHRVEHRYDHYDHRRFVVERPWSSSGARSGGRRTPGDRCSWLRSRSIRAPGPSRPEPNLNFNIPLN